MSCEECSKRAMLDEIQSEGAKAFYDGKKQNDNPYNETYNRPKVITRGVNDGDMTPTDWEQYYKEVAWNLGWMGQSKEERSNSRIRQLEEELRAVKRENRGKACVIEQIEEDLQALCTKPPFWKFTVMKKLESIRRFIGYYKSS